MGQDTALGAAASPLEGLGKLSSAPQPEPGLVPNRNQTETKFLSDVEKYPSPKNMAAAAMLSNFQATSPVGVAGGALEMEAPRKQGGSEGSMQPVDNLPSSGWSSSSGPEQSSDASDAIAARAVQHDPAGTMSWSDVERMCQKLDTQGAGARIESFDLSCMEEDLGLAALSPRTQAQLKALESNLGSPRSLTEHSDAGSSDGSNARTLADQTLRRSPGPVDRAYAKAAADVTESSYSFAAPATPAASIFPSNTRSPSPPIFFDNRGEYHFAPPSYMGVHPFAPAQASSFAMGHLQPHGANVFPTTTPEMLGFTTSQAFSSMPMHSAFPFHMAPMMPQGGDIIGFIPHPSPFSNPPPFRPSYAQAPSSVSFQQFPARQVSKGWPGDGQQQVVEMHQRAVVNTPTEVVAVQPQQGSNAGIHIIQGSAGNPPPFVNPPDVLHAQATHARQVSRRWHEDSQQQQAAKQQGAVLSTPNEAAAAQAPESSSSGVDKDREARKRLDRELFELNSRPTRSSSMVVPGATAVRHAPAILQSKAARRTFLEASRPSTGTSSLPPGGVRATSLPPPELQARHPEAYVYNFFISGF